MEVAEGVATVRLERLEKKNALTIEMYNELAAALAAADADHAVHAILLQGSADCFTAGNDLGDFLKRPPVGESSGAFRLFATLPELPHTATGKLSKLTLRQKFHDYKLA